MGNVEKLQHQCRLGIATIQELTEISTITKYQSRIHQALKSLCNKQKLEITGRGWRINKRGNYE